MTLDALTLGGRIVELLYGIDKVKDIEDPEVIDRYVTFMINRRQLPGTIEEYDEAITKTLQDGEFSEYIRPRVENRKYSEPQMLGFLRALHERMQERKPWPRPAFVKLPAHSWDQLGLTKAIAQIKKPMSYFQGRFNKSFDMVPVGDGKIPVLLLELRSGDVVAVVGSVDPRSTTFTVMERGDADPAPLIAHFSEVTGIPADQIEAL
jgi:hypothetical protein